MMRKIQAVVTIKEIKNLPKLGLYSLPSVYVIIQSSASQSVSGISVPSCSPFWNYQTKISAEDELQTIKFYVYNSNPNNVDELLAYGQVEFESLLTNVPTQTKITLKDAKQNLLRCYLIIEHSDSSPPFQNFSQYDSKSIISVNYLRIYAQNYQSKKWLSLFPQKNLILSYNNNSKQISNAYPEASFRFSTQNSRVQAKLQLGTRFIEEQIQLANVNENSCIRLKFYEKQYQVFCDLCVRIIKNGYLPDQLSILSFEVSQIQLKPQKTKTVNWSIMLHSAFTNKIIKSVKEHATLYVQNNMEIKIDYFYEVDQKQIEDIQPTSTYTFNINSINWSQNYEAEETLNLYNQDKGLAIILKCKMFLMKSMQEKTLLTPKFENPEFLIDKGHSNYKISAVKLEYACFSEIFTEKTILTLIYVNKMGKVIQFPSFELKNSTQYIIATKQVIQEEEGGMLYLVTFDHFFGFEKQQPCFINHVICKTQITDIALISDAQFKFNQKFLAFAKKITVTKVCKKFDQMIRDKTLKITMGVKQVSAFQPGTLTIHNCVLNGQKNSMKLTLFVDSNQFGMQGITDNYMLKQPYHIPVKSSEIILRLQYSGNLRELHSDFQELFGTPSEHKIYRLQFPISANEKLFMMYSFKRNPLLKPPLKENPKLIEQKSQFDEQTSISIKLKSARIVVENCQSYVLRVNRADTTLQSHSYSPSAGQIKFLSNQKMFFKGSERKIIKDSKIAPEARYIFFSLYCLKKQNTKVKETVIEGEQEKEGQLEKLVIYSGHFDIMWLLGKGHYEVMLKQADETQKKTASVVFELLHNKPLMVPEAKLKIQQIECSELMIFKPAFKYYLAAEVESIIVGIFEARKDTNMGENIMKIDQSLKLKNGDCILWKLYSSLRSLTKELFVSGQKQLIASGTQFWTALSPGDCLINLKYRPPRQLKNKLNQNKLSMIEINTKIQIKSTCTPIDGTQLSVLRKKLKYTDIDILHSGAGILNINQVVPAFSVGKNIEFSIKTSSQQNICKFNCFAQMPLYQHSLIDIRNMQIDFQVSKSFKVNENYQKVSQKKLVNLRGKHIRTNQNFGINLHFPGICSMKASLTILSNKFTNNPSGKLILKEFICKGDNLKGIQIYPLDNSRLLAEPGILEKLEPLRFPMQNKTATSLENKQIRTHSVSFCLFIVLVLQNKGKVKTVVQLAKIDIDKLEQKGFRHEWLVEGINTTYLLGLEGEYINDRLQKSENEEIEYYLQSEGSTKKVISKYHEADYKKLQIKGGELIRPDRKLGSKIIIDMPDRFESRQIYGVLENGSEIRLSKYEHNRQIFTRKGYQQYKIKTIRVVPEQKQFIIERIEQLERNNFQRRFLINRDNRYIAYLTQEPFAISDMQPQTMTITFCFHALRVLYENTGQISNTHRKIAWMENNQNDQILTKKFGLYVRHGSQCQPIRVINQYGMMETDKNQSCVTFGYEPEIDELQIYLYIHHELNQREDQESLSDFQNKLNNNWMKYLPISYGRVSIEKIGDNQFVGCELTPIANNKDTVDKALNKVIVRPKVGCFGMVKMQKKRWGFISINFKEVSAVELQIPEEKQLIYFKFTIEDTEKTQMVSLVTQAREITKRSIHFAHTNSLEFKFVERKKGQMYSMRVQAKVISVTNHFILFEKRVDMTQLLSQPSNEFSNFNIKIKTSEANGLQQPVEIQFTLKNVPCPQKHEIKDIARQINKVDIIKFEDHSESELVLKLIGCLHRTHLYENLKEIKESVIYSKEEPKSVILLISLYVSFQNDDVVTDMSIESLILACTKYPNLLQSIKSSDELFTQNLYKNLKLLSSMKELPLDHYSSISITQQKYKKQLQQLKANFKTCTTTQMQQIVTHQKKIIYSPDQILKPLSSIEILEQVLVLITLLIGQSLQFKEMIVKDLMDWNQYFLFKDEKIYLQYVGLLEELMRGSQVVQETEIRKRVIECCMERNIGYGITVEMWNNLPPPERAHYSEQVAKMLGKSMPNTHTKNSQSLSTIRTYLNYLSLHHIRINPEGTQLIINNSLQALKNLVEVREVSVYCELIIKMKGLKLVEEKDLAMAANILKKKKQGYSERSKKLVMTNLLQKLLGKQISGGEKNQNQTNKNLFYKKYLITS